MRQKILLEKGKLGMLSSDIKRTGSERKENYRYTTERRYLMGQESRHASDPKLR